MKRALAVSVAALSTTCVAGCGQPHDEDVHHVASAFYDAYAAQDGAKACTLLVPRTRSELEKSSGKPCPRAVLEVQVPSVSESTDVRVFGTQAEVTWAGETTFLARFQDGWKVMAAACKPVPGHPYDCTIAGG